MYSLSQNPIVLFLVLRICGFFTLHTTPATISCPAVWPCGARILHGWSPSVLPDLRPGASLACHDRSFHCASYCRKPGFITAEMHCGQRPFLLMHFSSARNAAAAPCLAEAASAVIPPVFAQSFPWTHGATPSAVNARVTHSGELLLEFPYGSVLSGATNCCQLAFVFCSLLPYRN